MFGDSFPSRFFIILTGLIVTVSAFAVTGQACEITQITPNSGAVGESLQVDVDGIGFGFVEFAVEGIDFGPGTQAQITNLLPTSLEPMPDTLEVLVNIDANATPGPRTVTVFGQGGQSCTAENGFTVTAAPQEENQPPMAGFSFSPSSPQAAEEVAFDASASFDPDGQIVQYSGTSGMAPAARGWSSSTAMAYLGRIRSR